MAHLNRIFCVAGPGDSASALDAALKAAGDDVQAVAVIGDLGAGTDRRETYRSTFRSLAAAERPVFWVPGPGDAPIASYLREAHNIEIVLPRLHGVHGTAALAPGEHVVVAGFGGEISDDPDHEREELSALSYPRWEPEYRLKLLREFPEHQSVLLFHTQPAHKGRGTPGSEAVAELIGTWRPPLVVCGGERGSELIGRTLVVSPGLLGDGHYAIVDLQGREAQLERIPATTAS
jgi:Icc-related predicted phosphoesterase